MRSKLRVFVSVDMEGITGIVNWQQVSRREPDYKQALELMIGDVNAAVRGALDGGADDVLVNDAHDMMANLPLAQLHPRARLISGFAKPLGMMQGVDGADVAMFVGYHARMGTPHAILDHTLYGAAFNRVWLGETEVGEVELNAVLAGHFRVPVVLVTGDATVCRAAESFIGDWVTTAAVKQPVSKTAAECLHPQVAQAAIQAAAAQALQRASIANPVRVDPPVRLRVELKDTEMADITSLCPFVEQLDGRTIQLLGDTVLAAYRRLEVVGLLSTVPALIRKL
ncbi:MAG: M55 family metallopeptidase [Candidatus Bipolaricaulaceae bacterium]